MLHDIDEVRPLGGYRFWLRFEDGVAGELDLADRIRFDGVFAPLREPAAFAQAFVRAFRERADAVLVAPGARHCTIFTKLCREAAARGNLVPDAWLAALAIESGCELVTTDRDVARLPGLRWRRALDTARS